MKKRNLMLRKKLKVRVLGNYDEHCEFVDYCLRNYRDGMTNLIKIDDYLMKLSDTYPNDVDNSFEPDYDAIIYIKPANNEQKPETPMHWKDGYIKKWENHNFEAGQFKTCRKLTCVAIKYDPTASSPETCLRKIPRLIDEFKKSRQKIMLLDAGNKDQRSSLSSFPKEINKLIQFSLFNLTTRINEINENLSDKIANELVKCSIM